MITQYQNIFERYEKKYLMNREQYILLMESLNGIITTDEYGSYTIGNIYLDTENYHLIRTSIEGPAYKEKIRLRSYGNASSESNVFLELKKKYKGIVYKRRIQISLKEANDYINFKKSPSISSQIFNEINWFMNNYNPVPKVMIAYDRNAFYSNENHDLRITFDSNIRWRKSLLDLSKGNWGNKIFNTDTILMEIKIPETMPLWLSHILSELKIFPVSFSKYGICYKKYLYKQIGGIICA